MTVPTPPTPDARTTRVTALNAAARIHQGTGATPARVIADAETLAAWIRDGSQPASIIRPTLGHGGEGIHEVTVEQVYEGAYEWFCRCGAGGPITQSWDAARTSAATHATTPVHP